MRPLCRCLSTLLVGALAAGCERSLSSADPAGPQAERISHLTWLLVWLGSAVFLVVVGALALHLDAEGVRSRHKAEFGNPPFRSVQEFGARRVDHAHLVLRVTY